MNTLANVGHRAGTDVVASPVATTRRPPTPWTANRTMTCAGAATDCFVAP